MSKYIFCDLPKMQNHLRYASLEQKIYKGQEDQRQKIKKFLSAFAFLCFSPQFCFLFPSFLSSFTFVTHFLLENKRNAFINKKPHSKQPQYLAFFFCFLFLKSCHDYSINSYRRNLFFSSLFF